MKITQPITRSLVAESHPSYYLMHKYWARKPHNVVRAYIEHFTEQGELVLDPFAGSGVTFVEALLSGRKAAAIDINPIASLITEVTALPIDMESAKQVFREIELSVRPLADSLFTTTCSLCKNSATVSYYTWSSAIKCSNCQQEILLGRTEKASNRYLCPNCQSLILAPSRLAKAERLVEVCYFCSCRNRNLQRKTPDNEDLRLAISMDNKIYSGAKDKRMFCNKRTLVYEGMNVDSFFTGRNLYLLSELVSIIDLIADPALRKLFTCVFTSGVAQASRLIPYRNALSTGGPAWTVSGFWIPSLHLEMQPWTCFANRFRKILAGKQSIAAESWGLSYKPAGSYQELQEGATAIVATRSSTDLSNLLPDGSVDYIFTDPPYGDSVPYLEYSTLWSGWFGLTPDYDNEVVISNSQERHKDLENYGALLHTVFRECYRILKPGRWLSITFHNRYLPVWESLVTAVIDAGFEFVNSTYQIPAVIPAKAQLSRSGSVTGDIILNFHRPVSSDQRKNHSGDRDVPAVVIAEAERVIAERGGQASTDVITTAVLCELLKEGVAQISKHDIVSILRGRFIADGSEWVLRPEDSYLSSRYEQLDDAVRRIINACVKEGRTDKKEVLSAVLSELHDGRTPDLGMVLDLYDRQMQTISIDNRPRQLTLNLD